MKLVWPAREHLASYVDALERGWSPDNIRGRITAEEELTLPGLGSKRERRYRIPIPL